MAAAENDGMIDISRASPWTTAVGYPTCSVLQQLRFSLSQNIHLQMKLENLQQILAEALAKNAESQKRADILSRSQLRYPKACINSHLRQHRVKTSYFVDYKMESPPSNEDAVMRDGGVSNLYLNPSLWFPNDEKKLKAGVRQKNMEMLSIPIQERMMKPDVTISQLEQLQKEVKNLKRKKETELLQYSEEIEWDTLAFEQFDFVHSGFDCHMHYKNFLQPGVNRSGWSSTETARLLEIAKQHEYRDWESIARELSTDRTAILCLQQYQAVCSNDKKEWSEHEDQRLDEAIQLYGINWGLVSSYVGSRTKQQCTARYHGGVNRVHTVFNNGKWQDDEIQRLKSAVELYGDTGTVWNRISEFVKTRNSTQCRERYRNIGAGQFQMTRWTDEENKRLMEYCKEKLDNGQSIQWCEIGRELNRRDDCCRRRWLALSSPEQLIQQRTVLIMKRESRKREIRKRASSGQTDSSSTTAPETEGEGFMSDKAREELEKYRRKVMRPAPSSCANRGGANNGGAANRGKQTKQSTGNRKSKRRKKASAQTTSTEEPSSAQSTEVETTSSFEESALQSSSSQTMSPAVASLFTTPAQITPMLVTPLQMTQEQIQSISSNLLLPYLTLAGNHPALVRPLQMTQTQFEEYLAQQNGDTSVFQSTSQQQSLDEHSSEPANPAPFSLPITDVPQSNVVSSETPIASAVSAGWFNPHCSTALFQSAPVSHIASTGWLDPHDSTMLSPVSPSDCPTVSEWCTVPQSNPPDDSTQFVTEEDDDCECPLSPTSMPISFALAGARSLLSEESPEKSL